MHGGEVNTYAILFLGAWIATAVVALGYWYENTYLRYALDKLIEAFDLIDSNNDEQAQE